MKEMKINVLYAVDLEDNTKESLLALPSGVMCPKDIAEKTVREFFGESVCDNDPEFVKELTDAICNDKQYSTDDYTFFFDDVTMYVPDEEKGSYMDDIVTVTCYGKTEVMTRREALAEYLEGIRCCEGSERERYDSIYCQLLDGATDVSDTV